MGIPQIVKETAGLLEDAPKPRLNMEKPCSGQSFHRTLREALEAAVGKTHASRVAPTVRFSEGEWGTVTKPAPLNASALPTLPWVLHVTPLPSVPVLLLPETSATVVPEPSLNVYAAT